MREDDFQPYLRSRPRYERTRIIYDPVSIMLPLFSLEYTLRVNYKRHSPKKDGLRSR